MEINTHDRTCSPRPLVIISRFSLLFLLSYRNETVDVSGQSEILIIPTLISDVEITVHLHLLTTTNVREWRHDASQ